MQSFSTKFKATIFQFLKEKSDPFEVMFCILNCTSSFERKKIIISMKINDWFLQSLNNSFFILRYSSS